MAYCTQADLVERYGEVELAQLTDQTAGTSVDAAQVTKACDEATSLIDGYVSGQYVVPLTPVPTVVRRWACVIARKFLWGDKATPDGTVTADYTEAMKQLRDAGAGKMALPDATGVQAPLSGGLIAVEAPDEVFTDDLLALMP